MKTVMTMDDDHVTVVAHDDDNYGLSDDAEFVLFDSDVGEQPWTTNDEFSYLT